jgi:hypothetical protein
MVPPGLFANNMGDLQGDTLGRNKTFAKHTSQFFLAQQVSPNSFDMAFGY